MTSTVMPLAVRDATRASTDLTGWGGRQRGDRREEFILSSAILVPRQGTLLFFSRCSNWDYGFRYKPARLEWTISEFLALAEREGFNVKEQECYSPSICLGAPFRATSNVGRRWTRKVDSFFFLFFFPGDSF
jgi:hypothetical protein